MLYKNCFEYTICKYKKKIVGKYDISCSNTILLQHVQ